MADLDTAIEFMLKLEDSTLVGTITSIAGDNGGRTRFGVAEKFHPDLTKTGFYDIMNREDALNLAKLMYRTEYCAQLRLDQFSSQIVANSLLSFGVNEGISQAVKIFQRALSLPADGIVGSRTLSQFNTMTDTLILLAVYQDQKAFYTELVEKKSQDQKFFNGWINRAKASTVDQIAAH